MPRRLNSEKAKGIIAQLIIKNSPSEVEEQDDLDFFEIDTQIGYTRPRLSEKEEIDDELPDYIKLALFLAREKALRHKKGA